MSQREDKIVTPHRVYTTRDIMKITEQRRLQKEAEAKVKAAQPKIPKEVEPVVPVIKLPLLATTVHTPQIKEEIEKFSSQVNLSFSQTFAQEQEVYKNRIQKFNDSKVIEEVPVDSIAELLLVIPVIYFACLLVIPMSFIDMWVEKLNQWIINGSYLILKLPHAVTNVQDAVLVSRQYRISLQGDWLSYYSIAFSSVFSLLFAVVERTTWLKRCMIFISIIPLAILINVLRVVITSGIALNYGPKVADQYFWGLSQPFVFVLMTLGLIVVTLLLRKEK